MLSTIKVQRNVKIGPWVRDWAKAISGVFQTGKGVSVCNITSIRNVWLRSRKMRNIRNTATWVVFFAVLRHCLCCVCCGLLRVALLRLLRFLTEGRDIAVPGVTEIGCKIAARRAVSDPYHLGLDAVPLKPRGKSPLIEWLAVYVRPSRFG